MNRAAIEHRPNSEDAHAISRDQAVIRLRTGQGDCQRVTVATVDKYRYVFDWTDFFRDEFRFVEMERVAADGLFDTWEAVIDHQVTALHYYFRLEGADEVVCLGEDAFFDEAEARPRCLYTLPATEGGDLFRTPDWARDSIVYQIFPDSFYRGDRFEDPGRFHDWDAEHLGYPYLLGGTLQGIIDKLGYLEALGVNTLYLTPVFRSPSNHRYNTTDYHQVDPVLGSAETLKVLVDQAHQQGMRVILDANVHATGVEFFAFQDLVERGAQSRYRDWYHVEGFPLQMTTPPNYRAWAYVPRLPKLNLDNAEVVDYLLDALVYWVRELDIDGWRLDTCDEVSHSFWRETRRRVKAAKPEALLVGEVWYDARPWLAGDQLDSVMNYAFRGAALDFFAQARLSPEAFGQRLAWVRGRYKQQAWQVLWNLLGSHDTARFLAEAGGDAERLKLAALFQFTYPGVPYIYYGDEVGMVVNSLRFRAGMIWDEHRQDRALLGYYSKLARLRREHAVLTRGGFEETLADNSRDLYGFRRWLDGHEVQVYLNNGSQEQRVALDGRWFDLLREGVAVVHQVRLPPCSGAVLTRD